MLIPLSTPTVVSAGRCVSGGVLRILGPRCVQALRSLRYCFTAVDDHLGQGLQRRGFSSKEICQAYRDLHRVAQRDRRYLADVASFRVLGVPLRAFAGFKASGLSLTSFYNLRYIGGRGLRRVGWGIALAGAVTFGTGLVVGGVGAIAMATCKGELCGMGFGYFLVIPGGIVAGLGALVAIVGLPLGLVGSNQVDGWLPPNHLETVTRAKLLLRLVKRDRSAARIELSVQPVVTWRGGGMALQLRF